MKTAVYSGTKNIYENMLISAKSLLEHSNVEKIFFLIEDDVFPYTLPKEIECINISNQQYFSCDGPNYDNVLTYMVLLRAAYPKIFPELDKILSIDMDTIVNENISDLWEIDLTNYYLAAVEERVLTKKEGSYFNMGVAMFNLQKMREDKIDEELINALNTYWYRYKEQDCFNEILRGQVLILPPDYNCCIQANEPIHEKITHFAGIYTLNKFPHFNYYKNLPIEKIQKNKQDNITLDIIIPTYKNKLGLRKTLNSIFSSNLKDYNKINTIVVDDCSNLDYNDILCDYPLIHFYQLKANQGPGMARQFGLEHGHGTYIIFVDTGDYFYENGLNNILNQIQENTYIKMYDWSYIYDNNNILVDYRDDKTIGSVYKRSFIEMYGIHFSKDGSYANEDYGFSRACRIILNQLNEYGFWPMTKLIKIPILYEHIDQNSLTKKDNCDFFYTQLSKGIIINGLHAINLAKKNHVELENLIDEYNYILAQEYFFLITIAYERPDLLEDEWSLIRTFYFENYRQYIKIAPKTLSLHYQDCITQIKRRLSNINKINLNINKFLKELEEETFVPINYYRIND